MKVLYHTNRFSITILFIFIGSISLAQTKLVVNGGKIKMANGVYLSTNDLSITGNSLLDVDQSTLKIAGSTTSAGAINARKGTTELNGTAAQQLAAGSFTGKTVSALTINNTSEATVNDTLNITNVLTVSKGKLISEGFVTLKSNDSGTARVAPITSVAALPISGDVIVERFIPPKRAFRFLTAPVNTTTSIRDNWMEGVYNPNTTASNINPVPNYGTHITGYGGHLNRFDETIKNNPSLFTFNIETQKWGAVANSDGVMKAGQAFRIMVRGSRSTNLNSNTPPPSPTTLRAKGSLVTGTVVLTGPGSGGTPGMPELSTAASGFSLIANPYASPVDWLKIDLNDVTSTMYIFDPTLGGANGRGAYISFNRTYGTAGNSNDTSKIDNNIQSGQAFFVQTKGPSPTVTFKETYKTTEHRRVFRSPTKLAKISLNLLLSSQLMKGGAADGLVAYFSDQFSSSLGEEDSYKFTNEDENIAILRNSKTLSIEGRKPIAGTDTLPLKMWQLRSKDYALKVALENFNDDVEGYVEDAFLHVSTRLSNETATIVPFTITVDSLSAAHDRFKIVFKGSTTLATTPTDIKAYVKNKGVQVDWTAHSVDNADTFTVEKSSDSYNFVTEGVVKSKATASASAYGFFDVHPFSGDNYYRVKSIDRLGGIKYSKIAKVHFKPLESTMSAAINGSSLVLTLKNFAAGKYSLGLINTAGQKVYGGSIEHSGGFFNQSIKLKNFLTSGVYQLQISGNDKFDHLSIFVP